MRTVIVGCGYVGLELGRQLRDRGHDVVGVRRSDAGLDAVADAGLDPLRADVTEPETISRLPPADWVVFAASSGGRGADAARRVFVEGLEHTVEAFSNHEEPPSRLVYTSSTGVYGDHDGDWVDEETPLEPTTEKTRVLAEAEEVALSAPFPATVARFAGLYGPGRYRLERYLTGPVTEGYLNMVHRDDAAGAVRFALEDGVDDVLLVVDDEPVSKWEFADWLAGECGVDAPPKRTKAERLAADGLSDAARRRILTSKRCSNRRLHEHGYEFSYPTFREGYRDAIDAYRADG
jgi:nucleoside-diphosphate-sugar epimerase